MLLRWSIIRGRDEEALRMLSLFGMPFRKVEVERSGGE
jgi:hypothetical protein